MKKGLTALFYVRSVSVVAALLDRVTSGCNPEPNLNCLRGEGWSVEAGENRGAGPTLTSGVEPLLTASVLTHCE